MRFGGGLGKIAFLLTVGQLLSGERGTLGHSAQKQVPEVFLAP